MCCLLLLFQLLDIHPSLTFHHHLVFIPKSVYMYSLSVISVGQLFLYYKQVDWFIIIESSKTVFVSDDKNTYKNKH